MNRADRRRGGTPKGPSRAEHVALIRRGYPMFLELIHGLGLSELEVEAYGAPSVAFGRVAKRVREIAAAAPRGASEEEREAAQDAIGTLESMSAICQASRLTWAEARS